MRKLFLHFAFFSVDVLAVCVISGVEIKQFTKVMSENVVMKDGALPIWAQELGLNNEVFAVLVREAFRREVPPIVVAQEWIKEMAAKMAA